VGGRAGAAGVERFGEFDAFVHAASGRLLHTAELLSGDRAEARRLVRKALARTRLDWGRLAGADPYAPARQLVVTGYGRRLWVLRLRGALHRRLGGTGGGAAGDGADDSTPGGGADGFPAWAPSWVRELVPAVRRWAVPEPAAQACREVLMRLSPRERTVLVLRHFENLDVRQTAALLGLSEEAVPAIVVRAVQKLELPEASGGGGGAGAGAGAGPGTGMGAGARVLRVVEATGGG
jgi:hypothetical protein